MKKLLMVVLCLIVLPLSMASATTYYYITDSGADHDGDDTLKIIGKPASDGGFDANGDCDDTSGNWDSGPWQGVSYVVVDGASNKSSRLGEAFFVEGGISKGTNLDNVDVITGTCTQDFGPATFTFKKFSADNN